MTDSAPPISLSTALGALGSIPPATVERLESLGLTNIGKLIAHLPLRHEREEAESAAAEFVPGHIVSTRGEITATRLVARGAKPRFEAVLMDGSARLDLVWFNAGYLARSLKPGMRLRVQGKAKKFGPGLQLVNPKYETLKPEKEEPQRRESRLRPVYPASERIDSRDIERVIARLLPGALPLIEDHLSAEYRAPRSLPLLADSYRMQHAPESEAEVLSSRRRLAYDELLLLQLGVHMKRAQLRGTMRSPALRWSKAIDAHIRERFPFALTPAQESVIKEIVGDLSGETPTNRLIQGDVGAGKTIVALYAMLMAVADGHQAALMAPTEILAEQHFAGISRVLAGSRVRAVLLTGSMAEADRAAAVAAIGEGTADLVVGTHALVTDTLTFRSLAVAVIDEQHRFGVHQRAALRTKGAGNLTPHVLVMTATPIPRTLAMTLFGDLDISVIDSLPPGRKPIATRVVTPKQRDTVYEFVRKRIDEGQQAYVVVPTIDATDDEGEQAAAGVRAVLAELEGGPLAGKRLAALHGRLKRATREATMERFRAGSIDCLVATTVIEVGVDVSNATVMVIERADRFGLAQLHQLRGRVGRGTKSSACILIADPVTDDAVARLEAMKSTSDGFALAEKDLEIRGPADLFGARQSGITSLKVADLMRDRDLLNMARRDASEWIARSPNLDAPDEALVRRRLMKLHGTDLGIGDVG